ncbi:UDP-N-acetylglucosamine 1-carboxyvinyltransferase [Acanthopleuribacter pedis]|uniref:UDP-N-acetylglucosamine 1-carboxyvinyltransferase n=1 Tax=Acanthopleuribacter pedis TaxID=442870 RepID=A0A8J7U498_9BACT|nr:UDP-N-acetylglucosamine 1-carboxyvinyltransferase [Acanthopleuribacter pedis]MBO1319198.1 UDP-N-acetylglucosamine 1-carboxyvinyltransferase [Acanthopleuribacter pedis]
MDKLVLIGNGPLEGEVRISGAKNASLPCLAASILTAGAVSLTNLPWVRDIYTMCDLIRELGLEINDNEDGVAIKGAKINSHIAPYQLVKTMRASILVLGPLLARLGRAQVSLPGGCAIGARPVDLHLKALEKMGAKIKLEHGYIDAQAERLKGAHIDFEKVTVTGTENMMMAATLAEGTTILDNAAQEPEVVDLANMLIAMGADIQGAGTSRIVIEGVDSLHGCDHRIIPDRIETGTYVCAAAITRGRVSITNTAPQYLGAFLDAMQRAGLPMDIHEDRIEVYPHEGLRSVNVATEPHPGFPTDMQAQFIATMTQAEGTSIVTENIFENRFNHVPELKRMGADIVIDGNRALTIGPASLSGAQVMATDLRASASLVIAGLIAAEETTIDRIYHLDRGYYDLEGKLRNLGAKIRRVKNGTDQIQQVVQELSNI